MSTTETPNLSEVSDLLAQFQGRSTPQNSVEQGDSGDAVQAAPSVETPAPVAEPVVTAPEPEPEDDEPENPYESLDQSLVSAARKAKWSEDKIKSIYEKDPELARDTLTAIRDAQRDKDRLAGELGSLKQKKAAEADAPAKTEPTPKPAVEDRREQAKKMLIEALGDGEQADALVKAFQTLTEPVVEEVASIKQAKQQESIVQLQSQFAAAAEQFFSQAEGAESIYGKGSTTEVPEELFERRRQVAEVADQLIRGSNFTLSFDKAFEMAHGAVSLPHIKQLNTKTIADKAAKRSAQASIPPSQARNGLSNQPSISIQGKSGTIEVPAAVYADAEQLLRQYNGQR